MHVRTKNPVIEVPSAPAGDALAHFQARFAYETDCWDVHATEEFDDRGFVLVDVRSPEIFERGHLPGAINIPYWKLTAERLTTYPNDTLFVVYCAGPHCNASTKGAMRLAELGRPVKEMIGGTAGWQHEGYRLETS